MLRARDIATLNDAYTLALEEEKIINYTKSKPNTTSSFTNSSSKSNHLYCTYCKLSNHSTQNCRKKPNHNNSYNQRYLNNKSPPTNYSNRTNSNTNSNTSEQICNYCKNRGHTIEECRKRMYNNRNQSNQNPRISSLNSEQSTLETDAAESDPEI